MKFKMSTMSQNQRPNVTKYNLNAHFGEQKSIYSAVSLSV